MNIMNKKKKAVVRTEVRTITPSEAATMLQIAEEQNANPRPVNWGDVTMYSKALKEGRWELNGESVKFDSNNVLFDGQHRLYAIVDSGIAMETVVTYNVEESVFVDQGRRRTAGDVMLKAGVGSKHAAAVARGVIRTEWLGVYQCFAGGPVRPDVGQILDRYQRDPGIEASSSMTRTGLSGIVAPAVAGTFHYLASAAAGREAADAFINILKTGDVEEINSPPRRLRERFMKAKARRLTLTRQDSLALLIRAFVAFVEGRTMLKVQINKKRNTRWTAESFPKLVFNG